MSELFYRSLLIVLIFAGIAAFLSTFMKERQLDLHTSYLRARCDLLEARMDMAMREIDFIQNGKK